ncbi:pyridoxal phosphate-dependent decarboxylase family protein [Haliangium sp.]|uniref:pyridoxal phosphate-dependent decarboxylase family protein n=1 Tax=Haliangium sp. TaxID=2663208 RepID=UPI003D102FB3
MDDPDKPRFHMSPEAFRRHGREVVDWIADYMERVAELPVSAQVAPGEVMARLPKHAPERGEPFEAMLRDLDQVVVPGLMHWQHPSFFGYFPCNTSGPSILGDLLASGLGVQGMLWQTSPACTEVETRVLDWLVDAMGLPVAFKSDAGGGGVIQDSASSAALCALLAARERVTGGAGNSRGLSAAGGDGGPVEVVAYTSSHAHSSLAKAAMIAGLGRDRMRAVEVDERFAMRPQALARAIEGDLAAGRIPAFVCATVGTTSSHAIDPVPAIAEICRAHGLWLHIDAAAAGPAAMCPEYRWIHDGVEHADSYCFNPHKWMFTNFDCDCFYVRDRAALVAALGILPEYLRNQATESGQVFDYRDWQVPLGRRFRALKLWFVLRWYGLEGLRAHLARHIALARWFADQVRADERFVLIGEPPLNLVCFRHVAGDEASERVLAEVNDTGRVFLSHTRLDGRYVLRMSIGGTFTEAEHVEAAWALLSAAARG